MKYSIQSLDINNEFLFFWGHQPSKDGKITKSCFSQWWISPFIVNDIKYLTAEHWMMAQKALLFNDSNIFDKIINTESPKDVKALGREIDNFNQETWEIKRYEIVKNGNFHKFSQNELLKEFLLETTNKIIVEASPVDPIWGIGLSEDDTKSKNPILWRGLNLLGFALMEVRDELKK